MLLKILTLVGVALALWSMARRAAGAVGGGPARGRLSDGETADLVRCRACGAWRAPGDDCACATPPTP